MANLFEHIEGVQVVMDDVLIYGRTEHDVRVKRVLQKDKMKNYITGVHLKHHKLLANGILCQKIV